MSNERFEVIVIGGGINGLSTLYHLTRRGTRAALLERFALGHERGSSHGQSRITRSAYVDAGHVRLMQLAHRQEWPRLEADAGCRLIHPTRGCFFGPPGGKWARYAAAVQEVGVDCDVIDPDEARRRFPALRLAGAAGALDDRTAGVVAAAQTLDCLARLTRAAGAEIRTETRVRAIEPQPGGIAVVTDGARLLADRVVVTAGAWAAALLPGLAPHLQVARQTVGYFELEGDPASFAVGRFPVWGNLGDERDGVFYGLPSFGRPGIKIARHVTQGIDDDPEDQPPPAPETDIEQLRCFLEAQFTAPVRRLLDTERCLYTNTPNERFILGPHPDDERIVIGAGFSGHGFKFGPLTGRILAELALDGRTSIAEFEAQKPLFAPPVA